MNEIYKRYRPKSFKRVVGQADIIANLSAMISKQNVPHALLFTGPSGCGKTTLARILKNKLRCSDHDFRELNCADFRGIDMVRDVRQMISLAPMGGECRIWLIDEAHQMSNPAQNAFLKMLEDTPAHVYFMLATTNENKLIKTIRTRCTEIKVRLVSPGPMEAHLKTILGAEKKTMDNEVIEKIIEAGEGSVRKALVLLDQVIDMKETEEQLSIISNAGAERQGIEIARALLNPRTHWGEMAKILKEVDEDPESLRWMVLGYCRSVMLGGGKMAQRAASIAEIFSAHFYDSKAAGLALACYEVISGEK